MGKVTRWYIGYVKFSTELRLREPRREVVKRGILYINYEIERSKQKNILVEGIVTIVTSHVMELKGPDFQNMIINTVLLTCCFQEDSKWS